MSPWLLYPALAVALWLLLVGVVTRIRPLVRLLRRSMWRWQRAERRWLAQPPPSSWSRRWGRVWFVALCRSVRGAIEWAVALPLRIDDFQGTIEGETADHAKKTVDGPTVSAALRVATLRSAATGSSTPVFVAAPFSAAAALSDVASAVGVVGDRGKLAAAVARLLALLSRLLGRDELVLTGRLLSSTTSGPGVGLLLSHANGEVVDSRVLWAETYEMDGEDALLTDPTERLRRLAVAAAIWTQFTVLRAYRALVDEDYVETLGTSAWESYAFHQVAARTRSEHVAHDPFACCLYAHAVDGDPLNWHARFNAAHRAFDDRDCDEVAFAEMAALHAEVEARDRERIVQSVGHDRPLFGFQAGDQFHFQVVYSWAVMALNRMLYWRKQQAAGGTANTAGYAHVEDTWADLDAAWRALAGDLVLLETALARAEELGHHEWGKRWLSALTLDSGGETVRIDRFLRQLEPRMLGAWASISVHLEEHDDHAARPLASWREDPLPAVPEDDAPPEAWHRWLVGCLERGHHRTAHAAVVEGYLLHCPAVPLDEVAHYNVACYFNDLGRTDDALGQLALALRTGHRLARAQEDDQLENLRDRIEGLRADGGGQDASDPIVAAGEVAKFRATSPA